MRIDLPEIMDQTWCPGWLHDELVAAIRTVEQVGDPFSVMVPRLRELIALAPEPRVVDLCSGGGGPALLVHRRLRRAGDPVELILTDLFPSAEGQAWVAGEEHVTYLPGPVDAAAVPADLRGVRTVFNALHHLSPGVVAGVMEDAAASGQPFLAVEALARSPWSVLLAWSVACAAWPTSVARLPSLRTLLASTLVPLVPVALLWEGFASCLRCYTQSELRSFAVAASRPGYRWQVGTSATVFPGVRLTWLEGRPVAGGP